MAATATIPFISVEEYLHSVYEPDVDYVDGELEDRNMGEWDHVVLQRALLLALVQGEKQGGYFAVQELRVQVSKTRFRVPDTCLVARNQLPKRIVTEPPLLCIEVLSPEDRFSRIERKCEDYLKMGVPEVWIFDPEQRKVTILRHGFMAAASSGTLPVAATGVELNLDELFRAADVF
jgi:Uma2 family endonuclease